MAYPLFSPPPRPLFHGEQQDPSSAARSERLSWGPWLVLGAEGLLTVLIPGPAKAVRRLLRVISRARTKAAGAGLCLVGAGAGGDPLPW